MEARRTRKWQTRVDEPRDECHKQHDRTNDTGLREIGIAGSELKAEKRKRIQENAEESVARQEETTLQSHEELGFARLLSSTSPVHAKSECLTSFARLKNTVTKKQNVMSDRVKKKRKVMSSVTSVCSRKVDFMRIQRHMAISVN